MPEITRRRCYRRIFKSRLRNTAEHERLKQNTFCTNLVQCKDMEQSNFGLRKFVMPSPDNLDRVVPLSITYIQARIIGQEGSHANQYGIAHGAQLMIPAVCALARDSQREVPPISGDAAHETVFRNSRLYLDKRPFVTYKIIIRFKVAFHFAENRAAFQHSIGIMPAKTEYTTFIPVETFPRKFIKIRRSRINRSPYAGVLAFVNGNASVF